MDFSQYQTLSLSRRGRVLTIALNRPDNLNAINERAHQELSRVFSDVVEDEGSDVIVITGAGRAFSAGGDIFYMQKSRDDRALWFRTIREAKRVVTSLLDCDKPVICKVNGDAMGLGATMALLCDVVFAVDSARFGDPHNNVALIAGDGGAVIWPQLIGYARAKHHLFTGMPIGAKEAVDMGLIHAAVPADHLDSAVDAYVDRLLRMPIQSLRWTKSTMNIPLKQLAHSMLDAGMAYEALAGQTDDHGEAIAAFRDKRKPTFSGR